ncbi:MAG TPA: SMP-30/gluconolactonase/LRE family protein [Armatimonadota bacterium]|jgi:gluconolactonase
MRTLIFAALALIAPASAQTLKDILAPNAAVQKAAGGFQFTEGPVWSPKGYLLFSDVPPGIIYRLDAKAGKAVPFRQPSRHSNGLTFDKQGRLIACESEGTLTRTEKDGRVTTLAARYEGKALNSPNDVTVRSDGNVYFTDPTYGMRPPNVPTAREPQLGFRGLYRVAPDGKITLVDRDFRQPNGVALSPDEKRLYANDTEGGFIRVYDLAPDGTPGKGRIFAEMKGPGDGAPDGMKVDRRGNIFCTGPGGVWVFSSEARLLGKISAPEVPANVAFGDKDMKTLYMTARTGLYKVRVKTAGKR